MDLPALDKMLQVLDIASKRHALHTANIANIDTPGYKAQVMNFDQAMADVFSQSGGRMSFTDSSHFSAFGTTSDVEISEDLQRSAGPDGNNVHLEHELALMNDTANRYRLATTSMKMNISQLKGIIRGGR